MGVVVLLSFATMVVVFYSTRLLLQIISFAVLSSLCELGFFFFGYPLSPQPPPPRRPFCQIFPTSVGHTLLHYALTRPLSFFSVEAIRRRNIHPIQKHTHTRHTHTHSNHIYCLWHYGATIWSVCDCNSRRPTNETDRPPPPPPYTTHSKHTLFPIFVTNNPVYARVKCLDANSNLIDTFTTKRKKLFSVCVCVSLYHQTVNFFFLFFNLFYFFFSLPIYLSIFFVEQKRILKISFSHLHLTEY